MQYMSNAHSLILPENVVHRPARQICVEHLLFVPQLTF
jgi:hypothetical protein